VQVVDGATIDPEHLLRTYDTEGPMLWLVTHVDRLPRAAQSDLVRAIRATEGSMMIGTVVGALEDAHAEGRVGTTLMGLVETRVLRVPDLEERREDIPALALEMLRRVGIRLTEGAEDVFECVLRAGWPGGVRELGKQLAVAFDAGGTVEGAVGILCGTIERAAAKEPMPLQVSDPDLARARLQKALALASGTVAVAARELRMSRQAFYRELRRLDLEWSK
jgi:DNA-binding NtrC family response regulator